VQTAVRLKAIAPEARSQVLAAVFDGGAIAETVPELAGIAAFQLARTWLLARREIQAHTVAGRVGAAVRQRVVERLLELGPAALRRDHSGRVQSTAVEAVERLDPLVGRFLPQLAVSSSARSGSPRT
jgi:ABC-type transport system involved in cytochrome bd biosynthesis fused ATPase/permease subunit